MCSFLCIFFSKKIVFLLSKKKILKKFYSALPQIYSVLPHFTQFYLVWYSVLPNTRCDPRGGHLPARGVQPPPLWSTWAPRRGRGGGCSLARWEPTVESKLDPFWPLQAAPLSGPSNPPPPPPTDSFLTTQHPKGGWGGWHVAMVCCSHLQLAAPIGQSPFAALPLDPLLVVPISLSPPCVLPLPPCLILLSLLPFPFPWPSPP